jgi:hypothetical protein
MFSKWNIVKLTKKGAIHVYLNDGCIDEMPFTYNENVPRQDRVEKLIDGYLEGS